jgi:hypothetical protein
VNKKRQFFSQTFGRNCLKVVTSVPGFN